MNRTVPLLILFFLIISFPAIQIANEIDSFLSSAKPVELRELLIEGLEKNLRIQAEEINVPVQQENIVIADSRFDPTISSQVYANGKNDPSTALSSAVESTLTQQQSAEAGIQKKFKTGLSADLGFTTYRSDYNPAADAISPQYNNMLLLNLTQPLLRDFGKEVNSTETRIAKNQVIQAMYGYKNRIREIAYQIESAYYDLLQAVSIYRYRIKSKNLASELVSANQEKFQAGLIPISEVQEAETAVASREELIVVAKQQIEIASNRIKDLLEIRSGREGNRVLFIPASMPKFATCTIAESSAQADAMQHRPDYLQMKKDLDIWQIRIAYNKNQLLPRLDLETTLGLNGLSGQTNFPAGYAGPVNPHRGNYFDSYGNMLEGDGYQWYAGIKISMPLGNRAAEARYRQSDKQKVQTLLNLKRLEDSIETDIQNAQINMNRSLERIEVAKKFEQLAQMTLDQEMIRLQEGTTDTFRILNFQDDLIQSHIREISAEIDYHKGLSEFFFACGTNVDRYGIGYKIDPSILQD